MDKKELRQYIRQLKKEHQAQAADDSVEILRKLEWLPEFNNANTILLYHSLPDEVDTRPFLEKWKDRKTLLLPVVKGDSLVLRIYTGKEQLQTGAFSIEEPEGIDFTDYGRIDLAIVPGVAFDAYGHRLGRGKGYYDRLLPQLPESYKIGICFPYQLVNEVPTDANDVSMNLVLTL